MTKIYQLMIGMNQVDDIYYDVDEAIERAKQLVRVTGMRVTVWEAEEPEDIPVDIRDWTPVITFRF